MAQGGFCYFIQACLAVVSVSKKFQNGSSVSRITGLNFCVFQINFFVVLGVFDLF